MHGDLVLLIAMLNTNDAGRGVCSGDRFYGRILEIAIRAGIALPDVVSSKVAIRCPFHDDDSPSAFLSVRNIFYCSVCTPTGGWTAKRFAQELGLPRPPRGWESPRTGTPKRTAPQAAPTFGSADAQDVWRKARGRARDDDAVVADQQVYEYLASRGLAESWESPGFGILSEDMDLPDVLRDWPSRGFRLVAPLHDHHGAIVNLQARRVRPGSPKTLFPRGARASGTAFANDLGLELLRHRGGAGPVLFGEGLTDHLALGGLNLPVLAAPGTGMARSFVGAWAAGRDIVIALDNDDAGDRANRHLVPELRRAGAAEIYRVVWPAGCIDACDVVAADGLIGLHDFLLGHLANLGVAA